MYVSNHNTRSNDESTKPLGPVYTSPQQSLYPGQPRSKIGRAIWFAIVLIFTLPALLFAIYSVVTGCLSSATKTMGV
jgi:hypothetical protein